MRRREFITLLGGAAAWPVAARAQQGERMRRIGVLMQLAEGRNHERRYKHSYRVSRNWAGLLAAIYGSTPAGGEGDADSIRKLAAELVALAPDVVLAPGGTVVGALQQASRTVPIVFVNVTDPIGRGYVASLSPPGGNATGFTSFEFAMGGKWLELLKETEPRVTRLAVLRDPVITAGIGYLAAIHALAPTSKVVAVSPLDVRDVENMERALTAFAQTPNGGLIMTPDPAAIAHRKPIITLAARHRLPAVYPFRYFASEGGLMS